MASSRGQWRLQLDEDVRGVMSTLSPPLADKLAREFAQLAPSATSLERSGHWAIIEGFLVRYEVDPVVERIYVREVTAPRR